MKIALVADFDPAFPPHPATEHAVLHAAEWLGICVEPVWIGTTECEQDVAARLAEYGGVWIAPGSPYRSLAGALAAIRYAREDDVPLIGTCGGFQHVVLEYARNVLGIADAAHAEYDASASRFFVTRLACLVVGKTMDVRLEAGSKAAAAYGSLTAREQYYCNFGINPSVYEALFGRDQSPDQWSGCGSARCWQPRASPSRMPLVVSGTDHDGEPRVIELPGRRFFLATLYVPQMQSQPGQPHPVVTAWLRATSDAS